MALPRPDGGASPWRHGSRASEAAPARREGTRSSREARRREDGRRAALRRRRFAVIVVLPVLLMTGSVYLHTISSRAEERAAVLEERLARAKAEGGELEVRVTELSQPGRVRELARRIGMRDAAGADMVIYGKDGEDGEDDRRETETHAAP